MSEGRYERELVNTLAENNYGVVRAPSSGSATERELPDVLAGRSVSTTAEGALGRPASFALAVEAKATKKRVVYVEPNEVSALRRFATAFGARPLLGARFKRQGHERVHYLVPPERAGRTQGGAEGNYSIHEDDAEDAATVVVNATKGQVRRNE